MKYSVKLYKLIWFICLFVLVFFISFSFAKQTKVIVGVYQNQPKIFIDESGKPTGFFIDLIEEIGRRNDWDIEYKKGTWSECLNLLDKSKIDIMPDVTYTPKRSKRWNFNSEPVLSDWFQIYVNIDSDINSIVDLSDKRVAVLAESVQYDVFKRYIDTFGFNCELLEFPDYLNVFNMLEKKEIDAAVVNRYCGLANSSKKTKETAIIFHPNRLHYATSKDFEQNLLKDLDKQLINLKNDRNSFYYRAAGKWFGEEAISYLVPGWLKKTMTGLIFAIFVFAGLAVLLRKVINEKTSKLLSTSEKLIESESKYKDLFDKAPAAYLIIDPDKGTIKNSNLFARKMLGYSYEEFSKKSIFDLYYDEDGNKEKVIKAGFKSLKSGESVFDQEIMAVCSDGTPVWVSLSIEPVLDKRGDVIESRVMAVNISKRKVMEKKLLQAQKMEALGVLSGGIAHDFNNILSSIMGYTELALENSKDFEINSYLSEIHTASERASGLVRQILAFSRQTGNKRIPVCLTPLVKEASVFMRASLPANISIKLSASSKEYTCADPTQIHQVIMNLCTNAWHSMEEDGGVLKVDIHDIDLDTYLETMTNKLSPGKYIRLTIKDKGKGIQEDIIDSIFDPFFTTKEPGKGTGMGLSVVHGIIKDSNAGLLLKSEYGKGSEFNIYFKVTDKRIKDNGDIEYEDFPKAAGNILLVDDEEAISKMIYKILSSLGYNVTMTTEPEQALDIFIQNPNFYQLVITDMAMPGMTGVKLASKMVEIQNDIPIILCTGYLDNHFEKNLSRPGVKKILRKPLKKREIAQAVSDVLKIRS